MTDSHDDLGRWLGRRAVTPPPRRSPDRTMTMRSPTTVDGYNCGGYLSPRPASRDSSPTLTRANAARHEVLKQRQAAAERARVVAEERRQHVIGQLRAVHEDKFQAAAVSRKARAAAVQEAREQVARETVETGRLIKARAERLVAEKHSFRQAWAAAHARPLVAVHSAVPSPLGENVLRDAALKQAKEAVVAVQEANAAEVAGQRALSRQLEAHIGSERAHVEEERRQTVRSPLSCHRRASERPVPVAPVYMRMRMRMCMCM